MLDRSVQFPNRYKITPVPGTADVVDLVPAPGEITEEGTAVNKNTLLKDSTAELFGLGPGAVPDDAFRLAKNQSHFQRLIFGRMF